MGKLWISCGYLPESVDDTPHSVDKPVDKPVDCLVCVIVPVCLIDWLPLGMTDIRKLTIPQRFRITRLGVALPCLKQDWKSHD